MSWTLITQLRGMQERECAPLGDMADQTAGRAADALEREMQRAETAEARVTELEPKLKAIENVLAPIGFVAHWQDVEGLVKFFQLTLGLFPGASMFNDVEQQVNAMQSREAKLRAAYHMMRVRVVQIANDFAPCDPTQNELALNEIREALFELTEETDALAETKGTQ